MPIKGINLCEHLEGCQTTALLLTSAGAPSLFEREKPRKHGILFLGFSRKPRNQGGVKSARSESEGQGFFALKEKPGKCGKLSPGFPGFSRNSWKAREAWTLLDFPTFSLAFPHMHKILQSQEFSAKIDPGEFRTPFSRVNSILIKRQNATILETSSQFFSPAFWLCTTLHHLNTWTSLTTKTTGPNLFCCSFVAKKLQRPTNRNIAKFPAQWATCAVNFDNSLFINQGLWNSRPHNITV